MKIDCSNVVNFYKEINRLSKNCGIQCEECPFAKKNNGMNVPCDTLTRYHTEKAAEILQKWSDENQVKTRLEDFKEKYPNHTTYGKGYPLTCCLYLGYTKECDNDCIKCWDVPV